jgi:hypothetical protein
LQCDRRWRKAVTTLSDHQASFQIRIGLFSYRASNSS